MKCGCTDCNQFLGLSLTLLTCVNVRDNINVPCVTTEVEYALCCFTHFYVPVNGVIIKV